MIKKSATSEPSPSHLIQSPHCPSLFFQDCTLVLVSSFPLPLPTHPSKAPPLGLLLFPVQHSSLSRQIHIPVLQNNSESLVPDPDLPGADLVTLTDSLALLPLVLLSYSTKAVMARSHAIWKVSTMSVSISHSFRSLFRVLPFVRGLMGMY